MKKLYRLYGIAFHKCVPLQATLSLLIFILLTTTGQAQVNAYARVTAIGVSSGKSVLTITNVSQTYHTFAVGEQVLIIQMQDNVINTSNSSSFGIISGIGKAGQYEEATISAIAPSSAAPTSITLTGTLSNTYAFGNNSSVQVVSFAKLSATNYTTSTNITAVPWSGTSGTGGIVAFQVPGTLTLKNSITVDGQGFAGGAKSVNYTNNCDPSVYISNSTNYGAKGEGIYLINAASNPTFVRGRARVASGGGGGSTLSGGGAGGSNYSAGGDGGAGGSILADCSGSNFASGLGGAALSTYSALGTRIFMGGGGGGGQGNNSQAAGGNGGGMIIIRAGTLTTSCSSSSLKISANGNDGSTSSGDDGAGGAGAAGTILLQIGTYNVPLSCPLTIQANGGNGGDASAGLFTWGAGGGGGGQGAILFTGSTLPTSHITTTTTPGAGGQLNTFFGSSPSAGNGGGGNNSGVIVGIGMVLPVQLVYFGVENKNNDALLSWTSEDESNVTYHVQRSTDGINFSTIGSVTGTGSGNYSFTDVSPESGRNYYRLEMAGSISAKTTFSSILTFNLSDLVKVLTAYPNPAHDHFYIRVSGNNNNKTHVVTITDLTGQLLYTTSSKPANSIITVTPNRPLKPGLYMFKVTSDGSEQSGKVMIQ